LIDFKRRQRGRDFQSLVALWLLVVVFFICICFTFALNGTDLLSNSISAALPSLTWSSLALSPLISRWPSSTTPPRTALSHAHVLAPERDTLVLYRILGNDLPPRHSPGQTLRNIRFMLSHESTFPAKLLYPDYPTQDRSLRVEKYYVLNRLSSPELVDAVVNVLAEFGVDRQHVLVIPFDWNDYARARFQWDGGVQDGHSSSREEVWGIGRPPRKKSSSPSLFDSLTTDVHPCKRSRRSQAIRIFVSRNFGSGH
jgi:hypothetical protein